MGKEYIIVKGSVRGKGRPRVNLQTGTIYTPPKTRDYEQLIARCYRTQGGRHWLDQPVRVEIIAEHLAPKVSKGKRAAMIAGEFYPLIKPDADNIAKIVLDALNGVAYNDDKQVVELTIRKRWSDEARVLIRVERIQTEEKKVC